MTVSYFLYILLNEIKTMFSQLAKRSSRVLPADFCTDHAHYVKNHRSTVLRRNKNMAVQGGTVSHYYILVILKIIEFTSLFRCPRLAKLSDVTYISIEHVDLIRLQWLSLARLFTVMSPIFPSDSRDIARLTVNGGHLDLYNILNIPTGRASEIQDDNP